MNGLVRQRARLAQVRRIQHGLAATVAAQAAGRVQMLETSRERLLQMRSELRPVEGATTGAAMARMGELAMRLDSARLSLGPTTTESEINRFLQAWNKVSRALLNKPQGIAA